MNSPETPRTPEEPETYVTMRNPSIDDWIDYNRVLFEALRSRKVKVTAQPAPFAFLVDFDDHAMKADVTLEEYFEQLKIKVGDLGGATLYLIPSPADGSVHVGIRRIS